MDSSRRHHQKRNGEAKGGALPPKPMRLSEYFGGIKIDSLNEDHNPHERINCKCCLLTDFIDVELFEECLGVKLQHMQEDSEPSPVKPEKTNKNIY